MLWEKINKSGKWVKEWRRERRRVLIAGRMVTEEAAAEQHPRK